MGFSGTFLRGRRLRNFQKGGSKVEVNDSTSTSQNPSKYYGYKRFSGSGSEMIMQFILLSGRLILLSKHCKIGDMFIAMPTKGCSDTFHDSKGCLVRQ